MLLLYGQEKENLDRHISKKYDEEKKTMGKEGTDWDAAAVLVLSGFK